MKNENLYEPTPKYKLNTFMQELIMEELEEPDNFYLLDVKDTKDLINIERDLAILRDMSRDIDETIENQEENINIVKQQTEKTFDNTEKSLINIQKSSEY